jgi:chromosome segregation ATPase
VAPLPPDDLEARVRSLEEAVQQLQADATAARELAAGADRDVSEVRAELRAHTQALNALRENQLDLQTEVRSGFAEMRTGMAQIVRLLGGEPPSSTPDFPHQIPIT